MAESNFEIRFDPVDFRRELPSEVKRPFESLAIPNTEDGADALLSKVKRDKEMQRLLSDPLEGDMFGTYVQILLPIAEGGLPLVAKDGKTVTEPRTKTDVMLDLMLDKYNASKLGGDDELNRLHTQQHTWLTKERDRIIRNLDARGIKSIPREIPLKYTDFKVFTDNAGSRRRNSAD